MYNQDGTLTPAGQQYFNQTGQMPPRSGFGFGQPMDPEAFSKGQRGQGLMRTGAGIADLIRGQRMQGQAEGRIEEIGATVDDIQARMNEMTPPSLMGDEVLAAATRNAAILGQQFQQDPSAELAAAQTAIESGADPATVARMQAEMQAREQQQAQAQGQQAFQQGLQYGQQDVMNQYAQQQQALGSEMDAALAELQQAQQESLMGQQLKGQGTQGLLRGVGQFASNYDKSLGGEDAGFLKTLGANIFSGEHGMKVQKTPGEFDHDTNDMILMAQTEGGLVDTGIRQTGGEFVLNPEQAEGLEEAYENVNPKKPTYEQLMALYEAARFLNEPQFDDDYAA